MNTKRKQQTGFTIIEVVLVLAIAALIFLMVFIALPALQRNQRDTDRKTAMSTVSSAVQTYMSNNRGSLGGVTAANIAKYADPSTTGNTISNGAYTVQLNGSDPGAGVNNIVAIFTSQKCGTTAGTHTATGASSRNAAIVMRMETGDALTCQEI